MAITFNTNGNSIVTIKCERSDLTTTNLGSSATINSENALHLYELTITETFKNAIDKFMGRLIPIGGAYFKNFAGGPHYYPFSIIAFPVTAWSPSTMNKLQILVKKNSQGSNQIQSCDGFVFYFLNLSN